MSSPLERTVPKSELQPKEICTFCELENINENMRNIQVDQCLILTAGGPPALHFSCCLKAALSVKSVRLFDH